MMDERINNGFWDLDADERAAIIESACDRAGIENFCDLSPEERSRAYEQSSAVEEGR